MTAVHGKVRTEAGAKRVWGFMHALGAGGPPATAGSPGGVLRLERAVKHDFWAATAFYRDRADQRVVAKFGREHPFLGLPMRWAGRWLLRRESHFYRSLADLRLVPSWLGKVEGRLGFVHAYIEGRPMQEVATERLDGRFFQELSGLLAALHARDIAYVDLHKPQNVIVGDDGLPYLIDFQISFDAGHPRLLPGFVRRWLLRTMIRADRYHFLKLKRRFRPDLLSESERAEAERRGWLIQAHRTATQPYRWVRRRVLGRLRRTGRVLPEGSK